MGVADVRIPVFSTRFTSAWGKRGSTDVTEDMEIPEVVDVATALQAEYQTDAHAAGYSIEGEAVCARMAKDALGIEAVRNALKCRVAFVDLDRHAHAPWPDAASALSAASLLIALFPNAAVFTTRKGARLVFILDQPYAPEVYEKVAAKIAVQAKDVIGGSSIDLEVDTTTAQWTRVFRMPKVVRDGTKTWEDPTFLLHIPTDWQPLVVGADNPTDARVVPGHSFIPGDVGNAPEPLPIEPEEWDELIRDLADPLARSGSNGLLGKLRAGEPFYKTGQRNAQTFKALSAFLEVFWNVRASDPPPEAVYSMFYASTAATQGNASPEEALNELWDMVARMLDARRYVGEDTHTPLPQKEHLTRWGKVPVVVYTGGSSRYLWDPARENFTEPFANKDSFLASFNALHGATFGRYKAAGHVLDAHGTYVDNIILDLTTERPHVQMTNRERALVLPVGRRVTVEPEYSADVALWLEALGANDLDGLLAWLHYSTQVDAPLCALYLCGEPNAGKSMIASALSMFYGGVFVEFDEAVTQFNHRLRMSPIVWLDEVSKEAATGEFRKMVANSTHKIERKYCDPETLRGPLRVVITANNEDALHLDDVRTIHDVEAITQRVRFIRVGRGAAALLERRGGRAWTDTWVEEKDHTPGALCRHIAWLGKHYTPGKTSPRGRLKVEGTPTAWHYRAMYSGMVGAVLASVADKVAMGSNKASAYWDRETQQMRINVVAFLADLKVRQDLKAEGVDNQDARATLRSICVEGVEVRDNGQTWSVIPTSIIADMPRVAFRSEKAYDAIREMMVGVEY